MKYIIRELKEEDLYPEKGLLETFSNLSIVTSLSLEEAKSIFTKIKNEGSTIFVAVSEEAETRGQVIGTIKLLLDQKFHHGGGRAAHLEEIIVRKGFEGQGIGKALWLKFLERARELGCYKIILDCAPELIPFYKKLGFYEFEITMRFDL